MHQTNIWENKHRARLIARLMSSPEHSKYLKRDFHGEIPRNLFTDEEVQEIKKWGAWAAALTDGKIDPLTTQQERFVEVARGRKEPVTVHEKIWDRFLKSYNSAVTYRQDTDRFDKARSAAKQGGKAKPKRTGAAIYPPTPPEIDKRLKESITRSLNAKGGKSKDSGKRSRKFHRTDAPRKTSCGWKTGRNVDTYNPKDLINPSSGFSSKHENNEKGEKSPNVDREDKLPKNQHGKINYDKMAPRAQAHGDPMKRHLNSRKDRWGKPH